MNNRVFLAFSDRQIPQRLTSVLAREQIQSSSFRSNQEFFDAYDPNWVGCVVLPASKQGIAVLKHLAFKSARLVKIVICEAVAAKEYIALSQDAYKYGASAVLPASFRDSEIVHWTNVEFTTDANVAENLTKPVTAVEASLAADRSVQVGG